MAAAAGYAVDALGVLAPVELLIILIVRCVSRGMDSLFFPHCEKTKSCRDGSKPNLQEMAQYLLLMARYPKC